MVIIIGLMLLIISVQILLLSIDSKLEKILSVINKGEIENEMLEKDK